jgi:hypothetical protein
MPPPQDGELLSKGQILQQQVAARAKELGSQNSQKPQQAQHEATFTRRLTK